MKRIVCLLASLSLAACGIWEHEDGAADAGAQVFHPVFRSADPGVLELSAIFIRPAACVELRGNLPGLTWTSGLQTTTRSGGYWRVSHTARSGIFDLSYIACGSQDWKNDGADYGLLDKLKAMTPDERMTIYCSWWDANARRCVGGSDCRGRLAFDSQGRASPAGNMRDFEGCP